MVGFNAVSIVMLFGEDANTLTSCTTDAFYDLRERSFMSKSSVSFFLLFAYLYNIRTMSENLYVRTLETGRKVNLW